MKKTLLLLAAVNFSTFTFAQEDITEEVIYNFDEVELPARYQKKDKKSRNKSLKEVNVFKSPMKSDILDLDYDGKNLWVSGYQDFQIHAVSPQNGELVRSIKTDVERSNGIGYDGKNIWLIDSENAMFHIIDPQSGKEIKTMPTPREDEDQTVPTGITWDGEHFWMNDPKGLSIESTSKDATYLVSATGEKLKTYRAHGGFPTGMAFDGKYLWASDNEKIEIYKIDATTFEILETYDAPGGQYPNGLASDGKYLWVGNNATDKIYQLLLPEEQEFNLFTEPDTTVLANNTPVQEVVNIIDPVIEEQLIEITTADPFLVVAEDTASAEVKTTEPVLVNTVEIEVSAFPNPTAGLVTFHIGNETAVENASIVIYDAIGKQLFDRQFEGRDLTVDLGPYDSGTFIYTVMANGVKLKTGRIVKEGRR
ncbi:MAG TPA: T9SS type A sorting domain-containing protein [Flavobacteriales bacterium]|nr:T9SS type A sorting domain-containing protein [Flavobacteriales bacterium]